MNESQHCINCGGPLDPKLPKCIYCGSPIFGKGTPKPWNYFLQSKKIRTRAIYPALILIGTILVIYIYLIAFDRFSETTLVQITPLWFFPIVFGGFGYTAEKMLGLIAVGQATSIADAYKKWIQSFIAVNPLIGFIVAIFLFPFTMFNTKNSILIAFLGSAVWGILLLIFFNGIFPSL